MDEATIKELSKRRIRRWNLGNEEERKEALLVGRFLRNRSWPMRSSKLQAMCRIERWSKVDRLERI